MPFAITLCLDPASAGVVEAMWRRLAELRIDLDRTLLGYDPHVTLGIYPDETPVEALSGAVEHLGAVWPAVPVALAGIGSFPGVTSILWAAPVVTPDLLDRHLALQAALPGIPVHPHYRAGSWVPHITLTGALGDPGPALAALTACWQPLSGFLCRLELVKFRPVTRLRSWTLRHGDAAAPP